MLTTSKRKGYKGKLLCLVCADAVRDALRERQREAEKAYHQREKELREAIGYTAWAEKKDLEVQKRVEANRRMLCLCLFSLFRVRCEASWRGNKEKKGGKRIEERRPQGNGQGFLFFVLSYSPQREEEMAGIKARWEMDDRARAIARADEENYRRGVEWHRREARMEAVKRVSFVAF